MSVRSATLTLALGLLLAPLAADAQPSARIHRIGVLGTASASAFATPIQAFRQALHEQGWIEGQNIALEYRWAEGKTERLPDLAAELVQLKVNAIVTLSTPAAFAAQQASSTVPIVMALASDPVGSGLITSLGRPGGNITGLSLLATELSGKQLQLLKEAVPKAIRMAVLWNSTNQGMTLRFRQTQDAAQALGLRLQAVGVATHEGFESAFATITRERPDALLVMADSVTNSNRNRIIEFAATSRLPTMYEVREFVDAGGLMAYGVSLADMLRRTAIYVGKILKGAKPADLPVEQPTRFELVINLKTAKALGLTIPQSVLIRADEVIR